MKFLFYFLIISNWANSQNYLNKGQILSQKTNLPIEGVNVKIKIGGKVYTTLTDLEGKFSFKKINESDSLTFIEFTHISYEKQTHLKMQSKFFLAEIHKELDEVVISGKKNKIIYELSFFDKIQTRVQNLSWDERIASFIPRDEKNRGKIITKLKYEITDVPGTKGLQYLPFIVNVYSVNNETKLPKAPLIEDKIVVKKINENTFVEVDISKYKLKIPEEGIFVVMELLDKKEYSEKLILSNIGYVSAVPAIKAYKYKKDYIRKSYVNYRPESYMLSDIYDKWQLVNCHYMMDVVFD